MVETRKRRGSISRNSDLELYPGLLGGVVEALLITALIDQGFENTLVPRQQFMRGGKFDNFASIEYKLVDPVSDPAGQRKCEMKRTTRSASMMVCSRWAIVKTVTSDPSSRRRVF